MRRRSANDHVRVLVTMTTVQKMREVQLPAEAVVDHQVPGRGPDILYLLTHQLP